MSNRERALEYVTNYIRNNSVLKFSDREIAEVMNNLGSDYLGIISGKYDSLISNLASVSLLEPSHNLGDINSVLSVFGTNRDMYNLNGRDAGRISSDPLDVLSIFDSYGEDYVDESEELISSLIKESASDYRSTKISEKDSPKISSFGDEDFEDYGYEEIFKRFNTSTSKVNDRDITTKPYKVNAITEEFDEETKKEKRRINQEEIAEFANRFNNASRKRMYGDKYQDKSISGQTDEEVDAILREFYGIGPVDTIKQYDRGYGSINEQDNKLKDYIRWFLGKRISYMFSLEIDINEFTQFIFNKLKNEEREIYHSIMKMLVNNDFDYKKVNDRSLIYFICSKINSELSSQVSLSQNYINISNYCFQMLRKRDEYLKISMNEEDVDDIIFKSSYNLADYLVSNGYHLSNIENGEYNKEIDLWIMKDILYWKSVNNTSRKRNVNQKKEEVDIKLTVDNFFKKYVNKRIVMSSLAIVLLLSNLPVVGDILGAPYNFVTDTIPGIIESINDREEKVTLKLFDDFEYQIIENAEDDSFADTYTHLVHIFPQYMEYNFYTNDSYEQLCLHEAYKSIKDDDIQLMDNIISIMCSYYQQSGDNDTLAKIYNKASVDGHSSLTYPVYVYRMLKNAGFDVLKYSNAVMDYVNNSDSKLSREHRKLIDEMMEEYNDYCEELAGKFLSLSTVKNDIEKRGVEIYGRS